MTEGPEIRSSRFSRPALWAGLLPAIGLVALVVWALIPATDGTPPSDDTPHVGQPDVVDAPPVVELPGVVADPEAPVADRVQALKSLAVSSTDAGPVLEALARIGADDPQRVQMQAMVVTAMARYPADPAAHAHLLAQLEPGVDRGQRILAIGVLSSMPNVPGLRSRLDSLKADRDAGVREKAGWALDQLKD